MASIWASSTTVVAMLPFGMDVPDPTGPARAGAVDLSLHGVYGDVTVSLLYVAIVCAVCFMWTAVWLLAVGSHLRSRGTHRT